MPAFLDITGKTFNYLKVIRLEERKGLGKTMWVCKCVCGKTVIASGKNLKTGHRKSCGCKRRPVSWRHGYVGRREYSAWKAMKRRCYSKNYRSYRFYGAKGIEVCKRWLADFKNFIKDVGDCPVGYELGRIDPRKNYSPKNVRWLSKTENRKRQKHGG